MVDTVLPQITAVRGGSGHNAPGGGGSAFDGGYYGYVRRVLGTDMGAWDPTLEADDAINHTALGLADPPNIHWQNRPTWQQVIQPTEDVLQ
jgi:hypothetical protein